MVDGNVRELPSADAVGVGEMDDDGMVVVHETIFAGMTVASYANGDNPTLSDGLQYQTYLPAGGGTIDIVANGLRVKQGASAESLVFTPVGAVSGNSVFSLLGNSRLRRGRFALWSRAHSYNLAATGTLTVLRFSGSTNAHSGYIVRARNTLSAPNNATGSLVVGAKFAGTEVSTVLSANAETQNDGTAAHNGTDDVVCIYYHNNTTFDVYYGAWASGWPTLEDMTFGARCNMAPGVLSFANNVKIRDPRAWGLIVGGGGSGGNTSSEIIIDRWRLTYWDP
jgi:hypothetical protein